MMDEGRLLQFSVDVLYAELLKQASVEDVHHCKDEVDAALEQCFYCLYGHPHKRAKAKHLDDHSANSVLRFTAIFASNANWILGVSISAKDFI